MINGDWLLGDSYLCSGRRSTAQYFPVVSAAIRSFRLDILFSNNVAKVPTSDIWWASLAPVPGSPSSSASRSEKLFSLDEPLPFRISTAVTFSNTGSAEVFFSRCL